MSEASAYRRVMQRTVTAIASPPATGTIELERVGPRYEVGEVTVTALERVDLRVEPGEFIVVLGPRAAATPRCST
jgi:ABC-type bacteriocin/lantibiotic exporter with double-glycine peptidase domain